MLIHCYSKAVLPDAAGIHPEKRAAAATAGRDAPGAAGDVRPQSDPFPTQLLGWYTSASSLEGTPPDGWLY